MGELKMEELSLPTLFEQACKINMTASESSIDQVFSSLCVCVCLCCFSAILFNLITFCVLFMRS